jgi:hypothetical protein
VDVYLNQLPRLLSLGEVWYYAHLFHTDSVAGVVLCLWILTTSAGSKAGTS